MYVYISKLIDFLRFNTKVGICPIKGKISQYDWFYCFFDLLYDILHILFEYRKSRTCEMFLKFHFNQL